MLGCSGLRGEFSGGHELNRTDEATVLKISSRILVPPSNSYPQLKQNLLKKAPNLTSKKTYHPTRDYPTTSPLHYSQRFNYKAPPVPFPLPRSRTITHSLQSSNLTHGSSTPITTIPPHHPPNPISTEPKANQKRRKRKPVESCHSIRLAAPSRRRNVSPTVGNPVFKEVSLTNPPLHQPPTTRKNVEGR